MHFRHISAKIQTKNLKPHFDWGWAQAPPGYALEFYILFGHKPLLKYDWD